MPSKKRQYAQKRMKNFQRSKANGAKMQILEAGGAAGSPWENERRCDKITARRGAASDLRNKRRLENAGALLVKRRTSIDKTVSFR